MTWIVTLTRIGNEPDQQPWTIAAFTERPEVATGGTLRLNDTPDHAWRVEDVFRDHGHDRSEDDSETTNESPSRRHPRNGSRIMEERIAPTSRVTICDTAGGFLPMLWWGSGADIDRQPYGTSYGALDAAERSGRAWAEQEGAIFVPYEPTASNAPSAGLVKILRETEGLDLRAAIARAREIEADASNTDPTGGA